MTRRKVIKDTYHIRVFDRSKDIDGIAEQIYTYMFPDRKSWEHESAAWITF